jgi:hypothetical protein
MTEILSVRGTAIALYKSRANRDGASAWAEVPSVADIKMHIPNFDIEAVGAAEIDTKVFGLLKSSGIQQELVDIREFGKYVTCFLRLTNGGETSDSVEVFLFNDDDKVTEIWSL